MIRFVYTPRGIHGIPKRLHDSLRLHSAWHSWHTKTSACGQVEKSERREESVAVAVVTLRQQSADDKFLLLQRPKEGLLAGRHRKTQAQHDACNSAIMQAIVLACSQRAQSGWVAQLHAPGRSACAQVCGSSLRSRSQRMPASRSADEQSTGCWKVRWGCRLRRSTSSLGSPSATWSTSSPTSA